MRRLLLALPIVLLLIITIVNPCLADSTSLNPIVPQSQESSRTICTGGYPILVYDAADNATELPEGLVLTKGVPFTPMSDVNKGDSVSIKVKATNTSPFQINYGLKLSINGKEVATKQLTLEQAASQEVSFSYVADQLGVNNVTVGNLTGSFTVKEGGLGDLLPPYMWAIIGIILAVIVVLSLLLAFMPKRKKKGATQGTPIKGQQKGKPGKPSGGDTLLPQMPRPGMPEEMQPGMQATGFPSMQQDMSGQMMPGMQQPFQQQGQPGMQQPFQQQAQPGMQTPFQPQGQPGMQPPFQPQGQPGMRPPFQQQGQPGMPPFTPQGMQQPSQPSSMTGMPPGMPQPTDLRMPQQMPQPQQPQPGMPFSMQQPAQAPMPPGMQAPQSPMMPQRMGQGMQQPAGAYPSAGVPKFAVSNLTITPTKVKVGEAVNISIIVSNNGSQTGKYSVVLRIGGVVENISDMTLPPGASQTASFTVVKDIAGDYYADVDGLGGFFTVIPLAPPSFVTSNFSVAPERVRQSQPVIITASVTNVGEITGNHTLILRVKGMAESQQEVTLGAGKTQNVEFSIVKDTPGFYPVSLENWTGKFVVEMDWSG
ncbi:MAG: hypothetical protein PHG36_08990 [Dehalococcoidia bacterium]|nr:hypothetical protein [Dehalococcoidia bacterium]